MAEQQFSDPRNPNSSSSDESLGEWPASVLAEHIRDGRLKAEEVAEYFLSKVRQRDASIRAFLRIDEEAVLRQARQIDLRRQQGEPIGPLAGLPVAVKDNICVGGEQTTCASRILEGFVPPYDAGVITRLKDAGAVLFGKTNMDEFAMGSSTENSAYFKTVNPWDRRCIPGGSSGGSAAAVASGQVPLALGTDTGGSIRQPASHCGVVGMKPTYGRVSRYGLVAFASSLDQIGPIARNVRDCALLLQVLAGHDERDSTSIDRPAEDFCDRLEEPFESLTIGVPREYFAEGLDAEVEQAIREAIAVFKDQGAQVKDLSLPHSPYGVAVYYLVATAEASSNLARYDGVHYGRRAEQYEDLIDMVCQSRGQGFGAEVKRRIMLGTYALSAGYRDAYYLKAMQVRRRIRDDFCRAFSECDVIVGPVAPTPAFLIGEKVDDPLAMYLSDIYTNPANLAGIPALSLPCGFTTAGLPIGLHLQAAPFAEETLLRVARAFERATTWHERRPSFPDATES
ncbi:MAG: glutamyl-tRNA(Gln) amidotransferase subunit A [Gemmatales bacterium]|nr:MAG: glutamyl-tRNA(Gln) amidotransferase subunit A [Gemmatales bacterium]